MRVCITGGIACGKSLLSRFLDELGVETIDADDIVHELLPDPAERRRLAAEVFADPERRKALEARLHPQVKARIDAWLARPAPRSPLPVPRSPLPVPRSPFPVPRSPFPVPRIAIIPLLFEVHWDKDYDIICCIASSRENQISRMVATRGYTREEAEARLAAQLPVEDKAAKSHYVIRNDGTVEELRSSAAGFVGWLQSKTA